MRRFVKLCLAAGMMLGVTGVANAAIDLTSRIGGDYVLDNAAGSIATAWRSTQTANNHPSGDGWFATSGTVDAYTIDGVAPTNPSPGFIADDSGTGVFPSGLTTYNSLKFNLTLEQMPGQKLGETALDGFNYGMVHVGIGTKGTISPDDNQLDGFGFYAAVANDGSGPNGTSLYLQMTEESGFQPDSPFLRFDAPSFGGSGKVEMNVEIQYRLDPTAPGGDKGLYYTVIDVVDPLGSPTASGGSNGWDAVNQKATLIGYYGDDWSSSPLEQFAGVFTAASARGSVGQGLLAGDPPLEYSLDNVTWEQVSIIQPVAVNIPDLAVLKPADYTANSNGAGGWDTGIWLGDHTNREWTGSHPNEFAGQPWNVKNHNDNTGTVNLTVSPGVLNAGESPDDFVGQLWYPGNTGGGGTLYYYAETTMGTEVLEAGFTYDISALIGKAIGSTADSIAAVELWAGSTQLLSETIDLATVTAGNLDEVLGSIDVLPGDAGVGDVLKVRISTTSDGDLVYFDNIQLFKTLIPEPASIMLLGLGAVALIRRR